MNKLILAIFNKVYSIRIKWAIGIKIHFFFNTYFITYTSYNTT